MSNVPPGPLSVSVMLLLAVSTRSAVSVGSAPRVTYWAPTGAAAGGVADSVVPVKLSPLPTVNSSGSPAPPAAPRPSNRLAGTSWIFANVIALSGTAARASPVKPRSQVTVGVDAITRSAVNVGSGAAVMYCASTGAPPPAPPVAAMTRLCPGPLSVRVMFEPAAKTRSFVRVGSAANVTYCASTGAPPPGLGPGPGGRLKTAPRIATASNPPPTRP